jgi:hypothetical protein
MQFRSSCVSPQVADAELAEQAFVGLRVDRDDHRVGVGFAVEVSRKRAHPISQPTAPTLSPAPERNF